LTYCAIINGRLLLLLLCFYLDSKEPGAYKKLKVTMANQSINREFLRWVRWRMLNICSGRLMSKAIARTEMLLIGLWLVM